MKSNQEIVIIGVLDPNYGENKTIKRMAYN